MFKRLKKNKKGFTLAELLIVVAIIGVLVAISIPIFTSQLEKAREATDLANMRSAYAECSAAALTETNTGNATYDASTGAATETVTLKQKKAGWEPGTDTTIGGITLPSPDGSGNQTVTVTVYSDGTTPTIQ